MIKLPAGESPDARNRVSYLRQFVDVPQEFARMPEPRAASKSACFEFLRANSTVSRPTFRWMR
eukprot:11162799-Lingulodinium_polyedra.AAC.1